MTEVWRLKAFFTSDFFQSLGRDPKRVGESSNGCQLLVLLVKINALLDTSGHFILTLSHVSHNMYLQKHSFLNQIQLVGNLWKGLVFPKDQKHIFPLITYISEVLFGQGECGFYGPSLWDAGLCHHLIFCKNSAAMFFSINKLVWIIPRSKCLAIGFFIGTTFYWGRSCNKNSPK